MTDDNAMVRYLAREEFERRAALAVAGQPARAELVVADNDGQPPVIRLYDVIDDFGGYWGISAAEVAAALDMLADRPEVHVHVNSPGGIATEGIAMANLLRQFPGKVVAIVDGLAASAASMVLTGADEVVAAPSSQIMVHEASSGAWGDAALLHKQADVLNHLSNLYADAYARKAGGTADAWRALMLEETWFSPEEAVAAGLADRLLEDDPTDDPAAATARHDLRRFTYAGRAAAPAPKTPIASAIGPAAPGGTSPEKEPGMSESLIAGLRERLGFAEDADEATILASLNEALDEQAETPPAPSAPPAGTALVDESALAQLRADAAAGREARAQQETERRNSLVTAAVADGRIAPAQREAWISKLAAEGETGEQVLASLTKGLIPLAAKGSDEGTDVAESDEILDQLAVAAGLPKGALRG